MTRSFFALKHYFYLNLNKKSRGNDIGSNKVLGVKNLMNNHNKQGIQYCKENAIINFL
ncbi:hypothetical protein hp2018_0836 [Helicobacter pylori 2018]|nr:hypothetical protein hp2017_0834 [Helicobacter pylori 2017]ADZ51538.1 hypothetical protein hp2018_0836 [Helicobacter pylori 2018]